MRRRSTRNEMRLLVSKYKESGKSRELFSKEHGISISKLSSWVNFFNKEEGPSGSFVRLPETKKMTGIRIRFPNGIEVESEAMPWDILEKLLSYAGK